MGSVGDKPNNQRGRVLVMVYPEFTEFEIAVATQLLARRYQLVTAAPTAGIVRSEAGMHIAPDLTLDAVAPAAYAALLIPAAPDMAEAMATPAILELIRAMDRLGRPIAAICGAPLLLAKAGVLRDRAYTVSLYRRFRDIVGGFDESYFRAEPVVEAENLVTAQGFAFAEFGLRLGERLGALRDRDAAWAYYLGQGDIRSED